MECCKVEGQRDQHDEAGSKVSKPEECGVCFMVFEETYRRPRVLPCGHTFCSSCVLNLINESQLTCPACRAQHPSLSIDDFPINYLTEAFIKSLQTTVLAQASSPPLPTERAAMATSGAGGQNNNPKVISERLQSLLQEEKDSCSSVLKNCRMILSQLDQYHTQLADWKEQCKQLEGSLERFLHKTRECHELLEQEDSKVLACKEEGEEQEQKVEAVLELLDTPTTAGETYMALDTSDHCTVEANNWTQKCWALFPDAERVTASLKVLEATEAVVDAAERAIQPEGAKADAAAAPSTLGDPASTIQQRVQALTGPPPANKEPAAIKKKIEAKDLKNMDEVTKKLVEEGRVSAVRQKDGFCHSSKITVQDDRVYLHFLQDQSPPPGSFTLQVNKVMPTAPPYLVFLDLAWPGSPPQRVHIRLSTDTVLAQQFFLRCTGQMEPCYQKSRLFDVGQKGMPGEFVCGGGYRANNVDATRYGKTGRAGAVWGFQGSSPSPAHFAITTRDREDRQTYGFVYGEVEHGLPVLKAAASHRDITEVTVVDCGVVISC